MNNKIKKKSPMKLPVWLIPALATAAGVAIYSANKKDKKLRGQLKGAQADFDEQLQVYKDSKFQPIDPSIADQENIYEDMEIDTTGFEMQRKVFLQQQANILQGLQMVGGSSGAASLAQALSMEGDKQTQQMGMTVTQMLNRSKELRYQEQGRINQAVTNVKLANAEGARQFEIDKLNTLMGVAGQKISGIRGEQAGRRQMYGQIFQAAGQVAGAYISGGASLGAGGVPGSPAPKGTVSTPWASYYPSDKRLKKNINKIGRSPSGINMYSFEYINNSYGSGVYQGVMSNEVPLEAVSINSDGYEMVNYSMLDIDFKQI